MKKTITLLMVILIAETSILALLWLRTSELETTVAELENEKTRLNAELADLKTQTSELTEKLREAESKALPPEAYQLLVGWCEEKGINDFYACVSELVNAASEKSSKVHRVEILEWYDSDIEPVSLKKVIDGDTVVVDSKIVRIVGYDAYELSEEKGGEAKQVLKSILYNSYLRLDVDDLEPRDKYGRTLGVIWFKTRESAWCPLPKLILLRYNDLVKKPLHIPPDEHPYWVWTDRYTILLSTPCLVVVRNCTGTYTSYTDKILLTGGVYKVYVDGVFARRLILMNGSLTVRLNIP